MADTHIFLELPDIQGGGESSAGGSHYSKIELESLSWGMNVKTDNKGSDGKGQVQFNEVTINKHFDIATTKVLNRIKGQKRASPATPAFRTMSILYADVLPDKEGDNQLVPVVEYELQDCYVSSVTLQCTGGDKSFAVSETFKVKFRKIKVTYHPPATHRTSRGEGVVFESETAGKGA